MSASCRVEGARGAWVPALAGGGIVTQPTLALVGESGPEAIIPLDRAGGRTVNLNVALTIEAAS